ncbi:MAG: triose-phosphate isomerase [Rickettsiales bacterium]|jgi:triosephosphate isomerase|nr:triose-phosphate isomerase [Rickettsiales bacterium]
MKKIIAGNWKLNGSAAMLDEMAAALAAADTRGNKVILCVPFTLVGRTANLAMGAQDCSVHASGAFTGEVSAAMLVEAGAKYCIVGHSERRQYFNETDEMVAEKIARCLENKITPIVCVGELDGENIADVLARQIERVPADGVIIAYEPRWAIGTGRTPTMADIAAAHALIKKLRPNASVLYGGGVKAANAAEIMATPGVDGVLVGGASLKPADFLPIVQAA